MKYVLFMSLWPRTIKVLISHLPRTRKFSELFKNTGGENLFLPCSRVGHALRPIFMSDWLKFEQRNTKISKKRNGVVTLPWRLRLQ